MAEALAILGGISSVLQIVDFTAKLVSHARELVNSGDDALREVKATERLAAEYNELAGIILHAGLTEQAPGDDSSIGGAEDVVDLVPSRSNIKWLATQCRKESKDIFKLIEKLRMTSNSSGWKRVAEGSKKALRFMKKKRELKAHLDTLQQTGTALRLALETAAKYKPSAAANAIMKALPFDNIDQREQIIEEAYPQTYQWALDHESYGIRTWLSSNSNIFWITGKPGSGKSTLMKFLFKSPQTKDYLQQWAQDSRLILARFYFWYLGTGMQTSTEGLIRSILYQIMIELPELAETAFPEFFEAELNAFRRPKFGYVDVVDAMQRLAAAAKEVNTKKKLCFFVDGLDEFRGDYIELVELLNDLSRRYDIKMLVSSRPWTVFSRAYEGIVPHLRLEDLTRDDIHLYVHNKALSAVSSTQAYSPSQHLYDHREILDLVNDVVEKAEGVFLWVFLVVRQIRRGVAEGDSVSTLRLRVRSFPPDLNKFFKELIYDRVEPIYALQTSQALLLAILCHRRDTPLSELVSFLDYWLILCSAIGFADPQSSYEWKPRLRPITAEQLDKAAQDTRQFLSSSCKDLLIMERPEIVQRSTRVTFLHRTVFDFLRTHEMYELLVARAPDCVKSGWILHLLAWSKLELLRNYSDEASIIDAALGTFHPEMSESFINALMACMEERGLNSHLELSSGALTTLAAYQKNATLAAYEGYSQTFLASNDEDVLALDASRHAIALLGMSHIRKFSAEHTDLKLLSKIMRANSSIAQTSLPIRYRTECSTTLWQLLLRRCYDESKSTSDHCVAATERLWQAAKIFIHAGASLSSFVCDAPIHPRESHVHKWTIVEEFLKTHAPPEFNSMVIQVPSPIPLELRSRRLKDAQASEEVQM